MTSWHEAGRIMQQRIPFISYGHITERGLPRWELSDEVVAHVQDFQFLSFTQPVWHGLHMVPTKDKEVVKKINCVLCYYSAFTFKKLVLFLSKKQIKNMKVTVASFIFAAVVK